MTHQPLIVRVLGKAAIPIVFVVAAHVAFSSASEPGGGFAAGAFAGAGVMLYGLIFGIDAARRAAPTFALRFGAALGLLALLALGAFSMARSFDFLDFDAISAAGPSAARLGAGLIEGGLMLVTACSVSLAFYAVAGRAAEIRADEW